MTDETTRAIIEKITVRYSEPCELPSGHVGRLFYDCLRLTPSELARLAAAATGHLKKESFDVVVGIAYTGILFAAAVAGGKPAAILQHDGQIHGPELAGHKILLVDDVIHSGKRLRDSAKLLESLGGQVVGFACIIDRSNGSFSWHDLPVYSVVNLG